MNTLSQSGRGRNDLGIQHRVRQGTGVLTTRWAPGSEISKPKLTLAVFSAEQTP
jgi:hypothetical protein